MGKAPDHDEYTERLGRHLVASLNAAVRAEHELDICAVPQEIRDRYSRAELEAMDYFQLVKLSKAPREP